MKKDVDALFNLTVKNGFSHINIKDNYKQTPNISKKIDFDK